MMRSIKVQEFAVPHVSTRDYNAFNRAFDAWLRRRGMENEAGARQRFAGRSKNKGTK
jgi:hypothetical protein